VGDLRWASGLSIAVTVSGLAGGDGDMVAIVFSEAAGEAAELGEAGPDHGLEPQVGGCPALSSRLLVCEGDGAA
jgi:hypothetical protein